MKRAGKVDREIILKNIIEECIQLLKNKDFTSNNDWETDTILIQAQTFLSKHKSKSESQRAK